MAIRGWSATTSSCASFPTFWRRSSTKAVGCSRSTCDAATSGRTVSRSPRRISATTGTTSSTTRTCRRSVCRKHCWCAIAARASRCSMTRQSATAGTSRTRNSSRRSRARARCTSTAPRTTCAISTRSTSVSRRPMLRRPLRARAAGPGCTRRRTSNTASTTPNCPRWNPG